MGYNDSLNTNRHQAIKAAQDLLYGKKVIDSLKKAKTEAEISLIMRNARREKFK